MSALPPRPTTTALGQLAQAEQKREHGKVLLHLGDPIASTFERIDAQKLEDAALDVLKPPEIVPTPTRSGEIAAYDSPDPDGRSAGMHLVDSLKNPDMITAQASLERYKLLLDVGCAELAQDLGQTIQPTNSIERMLAGQLASAHYVALRLLAQTLAHAAQAGGFESMRQREQNVEACRLVNAAARLMASFNDGALTLQKLRTGGKQTVVVRHVQQVQVHDGGQAVIAGDLTTGGGSPAMGGGRENGGTMPCTTTSLTPTRPPAVGPRRARRPRVTAPRSGVNGAAGCMGDTLQAVPGPTSTP